MQPEIVRHECCSIFRFNKHLERQHLLKWVTDKRHVLTAEKQGRGVTPGRQSYVHRL
jgi:hypothetical protein